MELPLLLHWKRHSSLHDKDRDFLSASVEVHFSQNKTDKQRSVYFPSVSTLEVCPCNPALLSRVNKYILEAYQISSSELFREFSSPQHLLEFYSETQWSCN